jgi:Protein of unknown function DUF262
MQKSSRIQEEFKSNVTTVIVNGDIAVILRALQNHTSLSSEQLKTMVCRHLSSDDSFNPLLRFVSESNWVTSIGEDLFLTDSGIAWLNQENNELTVEDEDTSNNDIPQHPYDVAKLKMEAKPLSVFQALRKIEKNELILNPDFQRAFVWDLIKQSRLIESILIRIPLPAFYIDATDQVSWNVVDGLQRLTTINAYCRKQAFKLTGLQFLTELEGLKFDELPPQYKILIEDDTPLLFYNLMPGTPLLAKYTIFSRVNTGGMSLTPQEIRHALNQGKSTKLLQRLAVSNDFRTATDGVVESLRMSDRELILRALAFMHLGVETYIKFSELDKFLLYTMDSLNQQSDAELKKLEQEFIQSLEKVRAIFGPYAFRKFSERHGRRSPLNKALFEVWTVSVRNYDRGKLMLNKDKIIDEFLELLSPLENFSRSISSGTSSSWAVNTRFSAIEKLLKENCK